LHSNTTCDETDLQWIGLRHFATKIKALIFNNPDSKIGFGYFENLINCGKPDLISDMNDSDFLVVNMKFGNTVGVTESFSLFEERMNTLDEKNQKY